MQKLTKLQYFKFVLLPNGVTKKRHGVGGTCIVLSSSSSGPGAYAPDALQPVGLLCNPCTILLF